ncbi:hypothetical protein PMAYCL1PPCAC_14090, partial [Pristionchus mayeri]
NKKNMRNMTMNNRRKRTMIEKEIHCQETKRVLSSTSVNAYIMISGKGTNKKCSNRHFTRMMIHPQ